MSDLLDRQAVINAIENTDCELSSSAWDELMDSIRHLPAVEKKVVIKMDAVATGITFTPNKHIGEWTKAYDGNDGHVKCTACFKTYDYITQAKHFNYCPNCGARMVGWNE